MIQVNLKIPSEIQPIMSNRVFQLKTMTPRWKLDPAGKSLNIPITL